MFGNFFNRKKPNNDGLAEGLKMAELAANKVGDEWKAIAYVAFVGHAQRHKFFTTEDVRLSLKNFPHPPELRAWGHIARMAQKNGIVESHDLVRPKSKSVHGRHLTLWQSTLLR
jgi:hypothetical protein